MALLHMAAPCRNRLRKRGRLYTPRLSAEGTALRRVRAKPNWNTSKNRRDAAGRGAPPVFVRRTHDRSSRPAICCFNIKLMYWDRERSSFSAACFSFSSTSPSIVMLIFSFKGFKLTTSIRTARFRHRYSSTHYSGNSEKLLTGSIK